MPSKRAAAAEWGQRVLAWHALHGRHDLPWQQPRDPYSVWVSEIMLQQTTVATVIPYYQRFVAALPTIKALALADTDLLMALWSGLGYYARARNLQAAAQHIVAEHAGVMPQNLDQLMALPGIGRSTAGAIRAQAFDLPAAILDGNVKRVLARHAGIAGWPGATLVSKALWIEAEQRLPAQRHADYAQAMMDLGATLCTRRNPNCSSCPVAADCVARIEQTTAEIPAPKPAKHRPLRQHWYAILRNPAGELLLHKRPPSGIWGGLWSLPEAREAPIELEQVATQLSEAGPSIRHEFSHFSLMLHPLYGQPRTDSVSEDAGLKWHTVSAAVELGLPAPIRILIESHCA